MAQEITQVWIAMLNEALGDDIAQLWNQALLHEHLVKLSLLGIDQETPDSLIQIVEHLLEVNLHLILNDLVKDLEKAMQVGIANFEGDHGAFNCE